MSRKKVADPVKLSVVFEPDEGGWHVHVPSLQGCRTWGRSLSEARRNIREAISLCEEELGDAEAVARDAVFEEELRLDESVRVLLDNAEAAKARAEAATAQAKALSVLAARRLAELTSLRDAGELLDLSQEGVRKLRKVVIDTNVLKLAIENAMAPDSPLVMIDTRVFERLLEVKGATVTDARALYTKLYGKETVREVLPVPAPPSSRPPARPRRSRSAHTGKG